MQLQDARKQKDFNRKFEGINRKMEETAASAKAVTLGLPYIDLSNFPVDLNALGLFSKEQAEEAQSAIFYKDGYDVRVGTLEPENQTLKKLLGDLQNKKLKPHLQYISQSSFGALLEKFAHVVQKVVPPSETLQVHEQEHYTELLKKLETSQDDQYNPTQIVEILLGAAYSAKASDIHIEPESNFVKIRLRLDGVLSDVSHLPKAYQQPLTSRLKIMSKLKLNVTNTPQDGRFSYMFQGNSVDVRLSALPGAYGEGFVLRILSNTAVMFKFDELGFTGKAYERIQEELAKPNGMILTTGPTGSGKTTTLYAFLNQLNNNDVKIITLEDPVEYKLQGVTQTPVSGTTGMTFASALRSIMRQDPDVVMVGEIRDAETADTALQASLTGHIVLSTLHTNDAAGAVPRLISMGVKPFVIAPGLNAIIAQRLVRRICPDCKTPVALEPALLDKVRRILGQIPAAANAEIPKDLAFVHGVGCAKCNNTGYRGRIGLYEVIQKNEALEKLILASASATDIKKQAITDGMLTIMQDGLLKALAGVTDVEEVFRVTQE